MATTYVPPIIEVYQEYRAPGAIVERPLLSGVVLGPCFHIMTYAVNKDLIYAGEYDKTNGNSFAAPNPLAGMSLLATNLKIHIDDVEIEIENQADGAFDSTDPNLSETITSVLADFVTEGVIKGDTCYVQEGANPIQEFKVLEVVDATTLRLNKNLGFIADKTALKVQVTRFVDDREISSGDYSVDLGSTIVDVDPGVQILEGIVLRDVLGGKMYMAYEALNTLNSDVPVEISSTDDIEEHLGVINGDTNPLAMGAHVMYGNAQRTIYALSLQSNDSVGWAKARDILKKRGIYAKALLSDETGIISLFKVLEEANQDPQVSKYGISIGTHKVEELETLEVSEGTTGESLPDPAAADKVIIFQDNNADFEDDGVVPSDTLVIASGPLAAASPYIIDEVVNANKLKVLVADEFVSEETGVEYTIERDLEENELAERIKAVSESFGHKRVVMTFPDECQIDGERLPAYYGTAIVAGMIVGLPPHAGLTNKGVAIVERVFNSNFKFEDEHLNTIAAGGTLIFMQDDEASLPYIRHQLTTDRTSLETAEISAIKNNDYVSFLFKGTMQKFLGKYNVQEGLFTVLRPALEADIQSLKVVTSVELGAILIDGEILELKESDVSADQIEAVIDTIQPKPFNKGILRIIA